MFENLSSKIDKALHTLRGKGSITDINIAETVKEVRKALLDADVSYPIAKEFTDRVKSEALGRDVIQSIEPGQLMVKIVHEELTKLMGSEAVEINIKGASEAFKDNCRNRRGNAYKQTYFAFLKTG